MKKVILTLFALATALAVSPVASAQKYDFSFAGPNFTATGWFTIAGAPSSSGNGVTNGGLTLDNTAFHLVTDTSGRPQYEGLADFFVFDFGIHTFEYDDLFFTNGTRGTYLDKYGLLFENAAGTEFINIWSGGADTQDSLWEVNHHILTRRDSSNGGVFTPTRVPEYGGLSMLILAALTLASGFFFKARQSGLFLAS